MCLGIDGVYSLLQQTSAYGEEMADGALSQVSVCPFNFFRLRQSSNCAFFNNK